MVERSVASKERFYFRQRRLLTGGKHLRFVACLEMIVKDVPSVPGLLVCWDIGHTPQLGSPFGRMMVERLTDCTR